MSHTWTLSDAKLELTNQDTEETVTFWETTVVVNVESYYTAGSRIPAGSDVYGTIELTHNVPTEVFVDDNGLPIPFDAVAAVNRETIELGYFLGTGPDGHELDFSSRTADRTVEPEPDPGQDMADATTALLARIIEGVADGEIEIEQLTKSNNPHPIYEDGFPSGWDTSGPTTIEVVYND